MSALPVPQPEDSDEQPILPLTPEMIGTITGVKMPERFLTNRHIKELNRRGRGIHTGYLIIKIDDGKITAIGDARFNLF